MPRKKDIYIPDKIFHKICEKAMQYDTENEFVFNFRNSRQHRQLLEMKCDILLEYDFLRKIHAILHMSCADMLNTYNIKNSTLSHRLCIPIKTVEGWKSGQGNCPIYLKLLILKEFNIEYLPKRIKRENEKPAFVPKKKKPAKKIEKEKAKEEFKKEIEEDVKEEEEIIEEIKEEHEPKGRYWSLKEYEQAHVYSSQAGSILSTTNYLDEILKRKRNN